MPPSRPLTAWTQVFKSSRSLFVMPQPSRFLKHNAPIRWWGATRFIHSGEEERSALFGAVLRGTIGTFHCGVFNMMRKIILSTIYYPEPSVCSKERKIVDLTSRSALVGMVVHQELFTSSKDYVNTTAAVGRYNNRAHRKFGCSLYACPQSLSASLRSRQGFTAPRKQIEW